MKKKIKKILVANRGEIALRVLRACKEMGIETVAIYSEVDKTGLPALFADEAVPVGPPEAKDSYLNMDRIIKIAGEKKCDAIHPGYGFLSENSEFARRCEKAGIIFIGPNSKALNLVGDKLRSRETMSKVGVPIIPGMNDVKNDLKELKKIAQKIGYPVIIKASGGGGGKGMRIVYKASELTSAVEAGRREAKSAFGDETVFLEKYIEKPRHVEFQVLADTYGNVIHLFERECSVQRRYQKIIEESPSTALDEDLRQRMGEAACKVMATAGYTNAGTVEFLLDENKNFYFLEVNARIQVEHPVTEMVTGVDLVKQQIAVARGEKLTLRQKDLKQQGHAIECRIYAEDPENKFFPSYGKIMLVHEPHGPGVRCDSGIYSGLEVPYHYDPILSKLIVWDETRERAIRKLKLCLQEYVIIGVKTQLPFLLDVVDNAEFIAGDLHTHFIAQHFPDWKPTRSKEKLKLALLAASLIKSRKPVKIERDTGKTTLTPWQLTGRWELFSK